MDMIAVTTSDTVEMKRLGELVEQLQAVGVGAVH
jgi:hypothetical protein